AASLAGYFAGVSYERLEGFNSQIWPVAKDGTDTPILFEEGFAFEDGKARLIPLEWTPPFEAGAEYDLHLNNGRLLEHFHEGNMTYKSEGLTHKVPHPWLEVSLELARERGIEDGSLVRLTSPYGHVKVRAIVTERVTGNELYLTMNTREDEEAVNRLTSSYHDTVTHTPNYKEMSVKMEVLEEKGESPLPKVNYRFGNRLPQISVRVEEKWKREDFTPITELFELGGDDFGESNQAN
ncbi:molybdopterin oxidoreductase family protein, partial [Bacillus sp. mrc49]